VLDVDFSFHEKTSPLIVYPVNELLGLDGKSYYKGYTIVVQVDPRWVYDDSNKEFFTARIWSSDSILVGIPSMPYDLCHWPEGFEPDVGEGPYKAMDETRNKIMKDSSRLIKYFYLRFPTPTDSQTSKLELSTKEIYDNYGGDETELDMLYTDIHVRHAEHSLNSKSLDFKNQYACWNVVRIDIESSKRGRPDVGPKISKAQATRIRKAAEEYERQQEYNRQKAQSKNIPDQIMSNHN
jgi:hypothetical protein